ncbi:hypothetical protein FHT87_005181 [Rhizobium sp. BK316]|uniref:hypothetical protein n=1 Tax=Rhizobium sp. BK316 TaxID=2587053 RepID=UPI00160AB237|nr:hypothetical protein [Rhizobium sp. BK316]MBB3411228.1 hypothetical protein [Rhizobium sp. BK316]
MNEGQIIELFVKAAEVDRKLPDTARPIQLKAMNHGYIHSFADMNHWHEEDLHAANWAWLDPKKLRATTNDVGLWEAAMEVIALIPDERKRRALWAWAASEAGRQPFAKWCKQVEGISRQLGDWRRRAAIECIVAAFRRKPLQHNDNAPDDGFTDDPEIGHKDTNIAVWRAPDARPMASDFDRELEEFSWAEAQNERRRQRYEQRKKRQAA